MNVKIHVGRLYAVQMKKEMNEMNYDAYRSHSTYKQAELKLAYQQANRKGQNKGTRIRWSVLKSRFSSNKVEPCCINQTKCCIN